MSSFLGFKEIINKVEITNPEDIYVPRTITNTRPFYLKKRGFKKYKAQNAKTLRDMRETLSG